MRLGSTVAVLVGLAMAVAACSRPEDSATPSTVPALPVPEVRGDLVTVSADPSGPANPLLAGVGWNAGDDISRIDPYRPPLIRLDADLARASQSPDDLDLESVIDRVAAIRGMGAEPLVILSYTPVWLSASPDLTCPGCEPWRFPPSEEFLALAERSHRAVVAVEEELGIDLQIGGPAVSLADAELLPVYLEAMRDAALPVDCGRVADRDGTGWS